MFAGMKKITITYSFILVGIISLPFTTLKGFIDAGNQPAEFIANDETFKNYLSWTLLAERSGRDPALGIFHNSNVENLIRKVYIKDNIKPIDGSYPIGTVIVKEYRNQDGTPSEFDPLAMVKRGGDQFNTSFNGWEWFRLDRKSLKVAIIDGVAIRGADLGNNACNRCHSKVKSKDMVFTGN